jgi:hypothetical protein
VEQQLLQVLKQRTIVLAKGAALASSLHGHVWTGSGCGGAPGCCVRRNGIGDVEIRACAAVGCRCCQWCRCVVAGRPGDELIHTLSPPWRPAGGAHAVCGLHGSHATERLRNGPLACCGWWLGPAECVSHCSPHYRAQLSRRPSFTAAASRTGSRPPRTQAPHQLLQLPPLLPLPPTTTVKLHHDRYRRLP